MPAIDDTKLASEIIAEAELGKERLADMPRDDIFLDAKGYPWARGKPSPMGEEHRIFAIFDFEDSDWVLVFGVPAGDSYRPDAFKKWRVHRAGLQKSKDSVGIPCMVSSMTLDVFRREVGENMWAQWVAAKQRRETREAAEALQGCLEEILTICKEAEPAPAAEGQPLAPLDAPRLQAALTAVTTAARATLDDLGVMPDAATDAD